MRLEQKQLQDKLAGCWVGKNIGGVLGAPFEGKRGVFEVDFYTQDLSMGPPPNDDLDLQIVWLAAVERYGRNVNASILGEYWLSYVIPNWVEYGTGKANLRAGLEPPMAGEVDNQYKNSCGCFIRSEVWACLAPGHPEIAARYAYEDAIVDHAGEGIYGEIFFAALQSSAFVETDIRRLIRIGLSYIPEESATAKAIREAVSCYDNKVDFYEARKRIHNTAPGTFGIQSVSLDEIPSENNEGMEIGEPGFDAPENVAFTIAGLLYGEGDFGKSICLANSCGEDTDCTCATLGATLGILYGESGLPEKWKAPLDDKIATMCIDKTSRGIWVPDTATQLAGRIMRDIPGFLGQDLCDIFGENGMTIECDENRLMCADTGRYLPYMNGNGKSEEYTVKELCSLSPYVVRKEFPAFSVTVDYMDSVFYSCDQPRKLKVTVKNSHTMCQQQWVNIRLWYPENVENMGADIRTLPLNNLYRSCAEAEFELNLENYRQGRLELILDVSLAGRHSCGAVKVTLFQK